MNSIKSQRLVWLSTSLLILGLISFGMIGQSIAQPVPQSVALNKLKQELRIGKVFHGSFEHTVIDSFTGERLTNEGEMWLTISKYKVITETQKLVVDGETSKVYDQIKERVIISKYDLADDEFAPSRMLTDAESEFSNIKEERRDGRIYVSMISDDPFATFVKVEITLNKQYMPIEIIAVEQTGNQIITRFSKPAFLQEQQQIFTLDYPESAKVVDLRQ